MATISSPGIGSGLDVNSIVTQMMKLEQRPLLLLQTKASGIETRISSYGQIKSAMSALYDAAKGVTNLDTWRGKQFASSNEAVLKGSATSAAQAARFSVKVDALAQAQSLASGALAVGAAIGTSGTLTLQTGRWNTDQSAFTDSADAPVSVQIDAGDTLTAIAGKINQKNAGVSAVVVKSVAGEQLLLRASKTGEENGFALSVSDPGLDSLAHDVASVAAHTGATRTQAASDARLSLNGIDILSASNTVQDVVSGVTLNLLKTSDQAVDIDVGDDTKLIKEKIEAFKDAYNKLNALIANLTRYDAASKTAQPLQGDGTAIMLQSTLRGLIGNANGTGDYLSNFGLELQRDGSLAINSKKLDAAMQDLSALETALTDGTDGLITRVRNFSFQANGVAGNITTRTQSLQAALKRNESDQERMSLLLEQRQKTMLKQYQSLDANMGSVNALGSFMSSQISQWNNKKS